ncbi:hypothetical protein RN001_000762 [Aquatica leii]|uniref:BESS domain-containing protein n=1 Tax=Aquatica leii TaxID=1421715 RepID=A0AAN7SCE5_9COLE|nr:hypothetical protein RN001_000762 [Aquatica leii]
MQQEANSLNTESNTLTKKWKNLIDNFMKSVKKKTKSGQAADSGRRYIYARQLSFLQQAGATTDTQSSVADDDAEETRREEATHETRTRQAEHLRPPRYEPGRSNKRKRDIEAQLIEYMKALIPSTTVTATPEINPDRSCFESILPSVSAFTEDQKLEFRCEVLNTIKRLRMSQHSTQFIPQCNVRQQERYLSADVNMSAS